MPQSALVAGARIRVRDAEWVVAHVERSATSGAIVHATGISGIVSNKEAIFVEAIENTRGHGIEVVDPADIVLVPDPSSGFADTLLHLEAVLRKSAPTGQAVQVAGEAAIDDLDFQLDPVRLGLQTPRVRILIGDDVGLGKTLEAGLLASELILRRRARRILAVTTKAMLTQFQQEFWTRFSIPLVRIDSAKIQQVRAQIPVNHNPFGGNARMPPVGDDPVARRRRAAAAATSSSAAFATSARAPSSPRWRRRPAAAAPPRRPEPIPLGRNKKHFPMSKGLIWLKFHALQVRQGPVEN
jgi:hypothetical protein